MTRRRLAVAIAGASLALCIAGLALLVLVDMRTAGQVDGNTVGAFVLGAAYALLGGLIAVRRPTHRIGWVFLGIGLSQALNAFANGYAMYGLLADPGSLPLAAELGWLASWAWAPGFTLFIVFSILLFPSGSLPSPRWRPVTYLALGAMVLMMVPVAVVSWPQRGLSLLASEPNPGLGSPLAVAALLQLIGLGVITVAGLASIASLLGRLRRARGVARQQLKWFSYAGTLEIGIILGTQFVAVPTPVQLVGTLLIAPLLPLATAIAILRYRLFDIDLIIKRTLIYTGLTAIMAAIYIGGVLAIQILLSPLAADNRLAVAGSTLLVAWLFRPARSRLQDAVDRRFYRSSYDAEHVAARFGTRLRDQLDLESLTSALGETVATCVRPASVSVWLRRVDRP